MKTKPRIGIPTTLQATSKLAPGQNLKHCAEQVRTDLRLACLLLFELSFDESPSSDRFLTDNLSIQIVMDPQWLPLFYVTNFMPCGNPMEKPADAEEPQELKRTMTPGGKAHLDDLKAFLESHSKNWESGKPISAEDKAKGTRLVRTLCTQTSKPKETECFCLDLYMDLCRGAVEKFEGANRQAVGS